MQLLAGPRPKVSENAFEDLLGGHSFTGKKEPKTMKELRKNMDVRDMDPDQRKVLLMIDVTVTIKISLIDVISELTEMPFIFHCGQTLCGGEVFSQ